MERECPTIRPYAVRALERRELLLASLDRFIAAARTLPDVRAIYVFGSLAREEVGPRSDLDLVVVRETALRGPARGEDLVEKALPGIEFDLRVLTPPEFEMARTRVSTFWHGVFHEARRVYAA